MRFRLLPREEEFFTLFNRAAANIVVGAKLLQELVYDFSKAEANALKAIEAEHEGDKILHEAFKRLNNTFITPLDREDIHALIGSLDDIIDLIEASCDRMLLYKVTEPTTEARELADVLVRACEQVEQAVIHLSEIRNIRKILDPCIRVNDFENEGDRINRRALEKLFSGTMEPLEALKWREIYDHFEQAIDKCEDVAHLLEGIVVKNA